MKGSIIKGISSSLVLIVIASMTNLNGLCFVTHTQNEISQEVELVRIEEQTSQRLQSIKKVKAPLRFNKFKPFPEPHSLAEHPMGASVSSNKLYIKLCTFLI